MQNLNLKHPIIANSEEKKIVHRFFLFQLQKPRILEQQGQLHRIKSSPQQKKSENRDLLSEGKAKVMIILTALALGIDEVALKTKIFKNLSKFWLRTNLEMMKNEIVSFNLIY